MKFNISKIGILVAGFTALTFFVALAAITGSHFFMNHWQKRHLQAQPTDAGLRSQVAQGELTFENGEDLARLNAEKNAMLLKLEWIDKKAGIARIPLEAAMKIIAEKSNSPRKHP